MNESGLILEEGQGVEAKTWTRTDFEQTKTVEQACKEKRQAVIETDWSRAFEDATKWIGADKSVTIMKSPLGPVVCPLRGKPQ